MKRLKRENKGGEVAGARGRQEGKAPCTIRQVCRRLSHDAEIGASCLARRCRRMHRESRDRARACATSSYIRKRMRFKRRRSAAAQRECATLLDARPARAYYPRPCAILREVLRVSIWIRVFKNMRHATAGEVGRERDVQGYRSLWTCPCRDIGGQGLAILCGAG